MEFKVYSLHFAAQSRSPAGKNKRKMSWKVSHAKICRAALAPHFSALDKGIAQHRIHTSQVEFAPFDPVDAKRDSKEVA
ncbi:hypothetical protein, partial [Aeromonas dhakensis]|uniref:hypothetical protein n=1 Tax=Aeromonas dhakensis TaxID=196024 RepID=UPI003F78EF17